MTVGTIDDCVQLTVDHFVNFGFSLLITIKFREEFGRESKNRKNRILVYLIWRRNYSTKMAASSSDMEVARKTWEIENDIETIPSSDEIFRYNAQEQQALLAARKLSI